MAKLLRLACLSPGHLAKTAHAAAEGARFASCRSCARPGARRAAADGKARPTWPPRTLRDGTLMTGLTLPAPERVAKRRFEGLTGLGREDSA